MIDLLHIMQFNSVKYLCHSISQLTQKIFGIQNLATNNNILGTKVKDKINNATQSEKQNTTFFNHHPLGI